MVWQQMAHTDPLPPIWDLLDLQPAAETLHLLNLVEFTDLLNGCAPDAIVPTMSAPPSPYASVSGQRRRS